MNGSVTSMGRLWASKKVKVVVDRGLVSYGRVVLSVSYHEGSVESMVANLFPFAS